MNQLSIVINNWNAFGFSYVGLPTLFIGDNVNLDDTPFRGNLGKSLTALQRGRGASQQLRRFFTHRIFQGVTIEFGKGWVNPNNPTYGIHQDNTVTHVLGDEP